MRILKFIIIPFVVLTLTVFLSFWFREKGDEGSVILGTIVYLPYIILIIGINFALILIGQHYLFRPGFKYLTAFLTTIILTIIFLVSNGHCTIHHWTLSIAEFIILNFIILLLNFIGLFILHKF